MTRVGGALPPEVANAGSSFTVTVTAQNIVGNTVTSYSGTVHLTSNDPQAVLPADATLTNGVGTFNVTLKTAGSQAIIATDATSTNPTITGTSSAITTRGLVVTVTQSYYGLVVAQRKYANVQRAATEAARFLDISQKLEGGGEVAHADVIKAELQMRDPSLPPRPRSTPKPLRPSSRVWRGAIHWARLRVRY